MEKKYLGEGDEEKKKITKIIFLTAFYNSLSSQCPPKKEAKNKNMTACSLVALKEEEKFATGLKNIYNKKKVCFVNHKIL